MFLLSGKLGAYSAMEWIMLLVILFPTTVTDILEKRIYLRYGTIVTAIAFVFSICFSENGNGNLYGMLPGVLWGLYAVLTKESIGKGDAVILLSLGLTLGAERVLAILLLALLSTIPLSLILLIFEKVEKDYSIPFVPFLMFATVWMGVM